MNGEAVTRERQRSSTGPLVAAAVFDLDGTLVDSMAAQYEAYRRAFADHGATLDRARFDAAVGATAAEVLPGLLAATGCAAPLADVRARKAHHLGDVLAEGAAVALPAADVARGLAALLPVALCTSASAPTVALVLRHAGLEGLFAVQVTGDDVAQGKPHPEPYLLVAARLDVDPAACLVFEDSAAGLASARAAGMAVVDVRPRPG